MGRKFRIIATHIMRPIAGIGQKKGVRSGGEPDASAPMIWSVRKGRGDLFLTRGSRRSGEPCDRLTYRKPMAPALWVQARKQIKFAISAGFQITGGFVANSKQRRGVCQAFESENVPAPQVCDGAGFHSQRMTKKNPVNCHVWARSVQI